MRTEEAPVAIAAPAASRTSARRRRRLIRWRRRLTVGIAAAYFAVLPAPGDNLPPPIAVEVSGVVRLLTPGTTVEAFAEEEGVRPNPGDFLDVEGKILDAGRFPGRLTVNGEPAEPGQVLRSGDVLLSVDGKDRTEKTVQQVTTVPGGRVSNPQTTLATAPGEQVITRGKVSGKIVSSVFRPTGPYSAPPQVALTFDDGPSPTYTPQILDILDRMGVKATFFVVGTMVERFPELVRREIRMGMTIANHTYGHPIGGAFADRPKKDIRGEMDRMQRLLRSFGVDPFLFRPPGGSWSDFVRDAAEERGLRTVLWAVDSHDWRGPTADGLVKRVLNQARPGAIILLHDGGGDRSATVAALPRIIRGLRERGLEPVAIS